MEQDGLLRPLEAVGEPDRDGGDGAAERRRDDQQAAVGGAADDLVVVGLGAVVDARRREEVFELGALLEAERRERRVEVPAGVAGGPSEMSRNCAAELRGGIAPNCAPPKCAPTSCAAYAESSRGRR